MLKCSMLSLVMLMLVAGTVYASTWTPQGGSPGSVPSEAKWYKGCKVTPTALDGGAHPLKWHIVCEDPPGILVIDDDAISDTTRTALQTAANQNDSDNQVHTGSNGSVDGACAGPLH